MGAFLGGVEGDKFQAAFGNKPRTFTGLLENSAERGGLRGSSLATQSRASLSNTGQQGARRPTTRRGAR